MYVPDEVRKCVVFVGYKSRDGAYQLAGTGFFISRHSELVEDFGFTYLVTAKHVIDGIRDKLGDKVCIRINTNAGNARWVEVDISLWAFHPDDSEIDIAVLPCNIPDEFDHLSFSIKSFVTGRLITQIPIGIGDEVFLTGLFANHHGNTRNIPILRIGNIAAMPEEPVQTGYGLIDAYLIEARSMGGISGSPVFVNIDMVRIAKIRPELKGQFGSVIYLLGLMHGHWDLPVTELDQIVEDGGKSKSVNMGIAIVIPTSKILEVIDQSMIKKKEQDAVERERKKRMPVAGNLGEDDGITPEGFDEALK